ncbi:Pentatricopeptide repeat-containing protein [Zostera marina]|uniref:Pentatricopeptide repeat-containing protein n=1 Tax=Zostera marina TaxID=29655 RepID=A0A0K9NU54_ZOSMR|nr:Pentatricopeptide repeat-containing protein [Zostera marina]
MANREKISRSLSKFLAQAETTTLLPKTAPSPPPLIPFRQPSSSPSPLPTLSINPATPIQLTQFLHAHLKPRTTSQSFTTQDLLHFLHKKLRYHPSFAAYDLDVFRWATEVDSFRHDHNTFEYMVKTLAVTDRFDGLRFVLGFMQAHPCPCSDGIFACQRLEPIYRFALNAFCRTGRVTEAESFFDAMKSSIDGKPNVALYNVVMNGFCKGRKHAKVVEWYDRMSKKDRVKPDIFSFNIVISSYVRNSMFEAALEVFKEMKLKNCNPNVVSFNTLITGFFKLQRFDEGIGVAHEMLDMGCGVSTVTCNILIDCLCKADRTAQVCDLMTKMMDRSSLPKELDWLTLIEALCNEGNPERGFEIVQSLWRKTGRYPSVVSCTTLIEGLKKRKMIDEACVLMEGMAMQGMILDCVTFNSVAGELCENGRTEYADRLRLLASKQGFQPDILTFRILVGGFSREGRRRQGKCLVDQMLDQGYVPNITSYNLLMEHFTCKIS